MHRGAALMVSTTRVMMTGFPSTLQRLMAAFWTMATFSGGTSSPKLPRLSSTASVSSAMLSKLSSAWLFSTYRPGTSQHPFQPVMITGMENNAMDGIAVWLRFAAQIC